MKIWLIQEKHAENIENELVGEPKSKKEKPKVICAGCRKSFIVISRHKCKVLK